jgi:hypothetical protein
VELFRSVFATLLLFDLILSIIPEARRGLSSASDYDWSEGITLLFLAPENGLLRPL